MITNILAYTHAANTNCLRPPCVWPKWALYRTTCHGIYPWFFLPLHCYV